MSNVMTKKLRETAEDFINMRDAQKVVTGGTRGLLQWAIIKNYHRKFAGTGKGSLKWQVERLRWAVEEVDEMKRLSQYRGCAPWYEEIRRAERGPLFRVRTP